MDSILFRLRKDRATFLCQAERESENNMQTVKTATEYSTFPTNPTKHKPRTASLLATCLLATAIALPAAAQTAGTYAVTNIVSDGSVPATTMDSNFINPWGVSNSPTFWINTQITSFSYVVSPAGTISFKVIIPAATGGTTATGAPTGSVTTASAPSGFLLPAPNSTKANFLFSSLDGIITGWNSKLGTVGPPTPVTQVVINNSAAGAIYTDIAMMTNANGTYLLATNFGKAATVEVYDSTFAPAKLAGTFTDPTLPTGYAPYSIHAIGTQVFVTYAFHNAQLGATIAPGNGMVNVFDTNGNFVAHVVAPGGNLNAPWGLAVAPTTFGIFGGDILVGNFGDGNINVYDPKTFAYLGQLTDGKGTTLNYPSLWELNFGVTAPSGSNPGNLNTLYFAAGLAGEKHGLFAAVNTNPTATGAATYGFSASTSAATVTAGSSATAVVSAVPTNNFSGTVALACSGLPEAATCTFSPAQLTVVAGAPATSTVTIATVKKMALLQRRTLRGVATAGITAALLLPFGAFLTFARRRSPNQLRSIRLFALIGVLFISAGFFAGCSSHSDVFVPSTPAGTSAITIKATSGTITQSTVINLTVQ
jgi:uncharacterized protein (TIGR03118 family)